MALLTGKTRNVGNAGGWWWWWEWEIFVMKYGKGRGTNDTRIKAGAAK